MSTRQNLFTLLLFSCALCLPTAIGFPFAFYSNESKVVQIDLQNNEVARDHMLREGYVAFANYTNGLNRTGWAFFHVITNENFEDDTQGYAAGYLEGYLSRELIYDAYLNFVESVLLDSPNLSEAAYGFINDQITWLESHCISADPSEVAYWDVACAIYQQLKGMYKGYNEGWELTNMQNKKLDFNHFYYLTNMGDLEDIVPALNGTNTPSYFAKGRRPTNMDCTAFIKIIEDDLVCAHTTFNLYSVMLRIYKIYELNFQNEFVQAKVVTFSARPGDLESKDDFYATDSNLVVMETSFNTYNKSSYGFLSHETVPVWLRAQVANKMARNATEWTEIFKFKRSGTHNSQWFVVDINAYKDQKNLPRAQLHDIVWLCEEYYYLLEREDVTQKLLVNQGYVAGYNVPFTETIYSVSNYSLAYGFNYTDDPRARLFDLYGKDVHSIEDTKKIIRLNNNETGDICSAIAPRCDIGPHGYDFGAIDGKVTSHKMLEAGRLWLVSSPPFNKDIPPFSWGQYPTLPSYGMPEVYDFDWLLYNASDIEDVRADEAHIIIETE